MTLSIRNAFPPVIAALIFVSAVVPAQPTPAAAPAGSATATAPQLPADPWPRVVDLTNGQVLVYQPQVNKWDGNQIDFRAALAIKVTGAKDETFGVIFATARTQVDKVARTVVFENMNISKIDFPTLPNRGAAYVPELQKEFSAKIRTIALDRLQSSLAIAGVKPPTVEVQNNPPQVLVSYSPAILVPIDGAPVMKPVPKHDRYSRVINTRALIVQGGFGNNFYIHVYDGWLSASSLAGPWSQATPGPFVRSAIDAIAADLAKAGTVDLLDGGPKANPKPSLANGVPAIYTSQVPTELIVFKGQPDFVPITGTQLLWASNTTSDVLINTANNNYYALLAGRWFMAAGLNGPWTFVASDKLPPDFARIPPQSLAGAVLPTVAGTPQAQEAVIENSIPQTATVPLKNGPKFTPQFDGPPQFAPVAGTSLTYVTNSHVPIIQVAPNALYSVTAGVWFTAAQLTGPWIDRDVGAAGDLHDPALLADLLRDVRADLRGDAAGGLRRLHAGLPRHGRRTVRHGRLRHRLRVCAVGRQRLVRATVHVRGGGGPRLQPLRGIHVGLCDGPRHRGMDGAVVGRRLLLSGLLGRLRVLRDGERQRVRPLGRDHLLGHSLVVRGRRSRGHDGERQLLQQPHRHVGLLQRRPPVQRMDRQRHARLRPHDEWRRRRLGRGRARQQLQHVHGPALHRQCGVGNRRRRQLLQSRRRDDRGTRRQRACRRRLDLQREDGADQHLGHRQCGQQSLRRRQRQRLLEHGQRLAAAFVERYERGFRAIRRGPTRSRRRDRAATTGSAASARRARCRG